MKAFDLGECSGGTATGLSARAGPLRAVSGCLRTWSLAAYRAGLPREDDGEAGVGHTHDFVFSYMGRSRHF